MNSEVGLERGIPANVTQSCGRDARMLGRRRECSMQYQFPIFENLCPSWGQITPLGTRKRIPKGSVILAMEAAIGRSR